MSTAWRVDGALAEAPVETALAAGAGAWLIHLPGGDAVHPALLALVEAWATGQEIVVRSERLIWRPGRMAVIGGSADLPVYRAALVAYDALMARLAVLQAEADALWQAAEAHIPLTHQVGPADLACRDAVNDAWRRVMLLRRRFTEIAPSLERAPPEMTGLARRVVMEFAAMADMPHVLETLDERIDVLADLYELANDRLSEFSHFHRELRVDWLIVGLLVLECALTLLAWWF